MMTENAAAAAAGDCIVFCHWIFNKTNTDVSAYTYERTVLMEQRTQVLQAYGNELSVINSSESIKPDELNVRRM